MVRCASTEFLHSLQKRRNAGQRFRVVGGERREHANALGPGALLRVRGARAEHRPRRHRATEEGDE